MAILSKFARQLAKRVKKKGPPKTNAQKIDAMTSKLKKLKQLKKKGLEGKTLRAESNKREKEQKLAREKAFAKYQKKKQNTKSIFKKQGPGQAQTQKAVEGQRRYKVGQAKGLLQV